MDEESLHTRSMRTPEGGAPPPEDRDLTPDEELRIAVKLVEQHQKMLDQADAWVTANATADRRVDGIAALVFMKDASNEWKRFLAQLLGIADERLSEALAKAKLP